MVQFDFVSELGLQDLDARRGMLHDWIRDVVAKVSLQVCDDE